MTPKKEIALFVLLGQSNAVGHALPMAEADRITEPLNNVYGLSRAQNQWLHPKSVTWSNYTSFGMNLGETQDNTYSVVNCLARLWQQRLDAGEAIPDLYTVQIAIGAQGISAPYMWNPAYPLRLVPGPLGTADIALYPFTMEILARVKESFAQAGLCPGRTSVHWIGGEEDTTGTEQELSSLPALYNRLADDLQTALPQSTLALHRLVCADCMAERDSSGRGLRAMHRINRVFEEVCAARANVRLFDPTLAPCFKPDVRGNGIFAADAIHFTRQMNEWKAGLIYSELTGTGLTD